MKYFYFSTFLLFSLTVSGQNPVDIATEPSQNSEAGVLFREIWSPYCKGVSLLECPSSQAQDLRDEINGRLRAGENSSDIKKELMTRYGSTLRMQPKGEGRESLAYVIPWIAFGLALLGIGIFWFRKSKRTSPNITKVSKTASTVAPTPKQNDEVLKDLNERMS